MYLLNIHECQRNVKKNVKKALQAPPRNKGIVVFYTGRVKKTCVHVCMYVCMSVCMYVCMYVGWLVVTCTIVA